MRQTLAPAEAPAGALAMSAADLARLGAALIDPAGSALLPAESRRPDARPAAGADPFGLADGWGLGLAVFDGRTERPTGSATTATATAPPATCGSIRTTAGWSRSPPTPPPAPPCGGSSLAQLRRLGVPLPTARSRSATCPPGRPASGCAGTYANGNVEFAVAVRNGQALLGVDDAAPVPLTFHDDLIFAVPDPTPDRPSLGGRFLRDPTPVASTASRWAAGWPAAPRARPSASKIA